MAVGKQSPFGLVDCPNLKEKILPHPLLLLANVLHEVGVCVASLLHNILSAGSKQVVTAILTSGPTLLALSILPWLYLTALLTKVSTVSILSL